MYLLTSRCGQAGRCLLAAVLIFSLTAVVNAADWPQYRGINGDGVSTEEILQPPAELWNASIGTGYSSIVIANGVVYAIGHAAAAFDRGVDTVYALDAETGAVTWEYSYNCLSVQGSFTGAAPGDLETAGPRATPATDGTYVYTLSIDGHLFGLDALTGEVVWYRSVTGHLAGTSKTYGFCASPVISGSRLLVDIGGVLTALDKTDGTTLWSCGGGEGWASVVTPVVGTPPLVIYGSRNITGVDGTTGALLWQYDMGREAMTMPLVSGNQVVFGTYPDSGRMARLTITGGVAGQDWSVTDVRTYHLTNVMAGGYLYAMDNSGTEWQGHDSGADDVDTRDSSLKCLDFATGGVQWTDSGLGWATIIVADDELVILREAGEVVRAEVNSTAYTEIGSYPGLVPSYCWTTPALADGRLYCRNDKGGLVCLSVAPCVTVTTADAMAAENGPDTGTFTVRRTGTDIAADLVVTVAITGTATEATDYTPSGGSYDGTHVTIPAGLATVDLTVTPIADGDAADETVVVTVQDGPGLYTVGYADSAAIQIIDSGTALPTVTVTAAGADGYAFEGGLDKGVFTVSRSAADAWPLTVPFTRTGTALAADYRLWGAEAAQVVIPAGQTDAAVTLQALDDAAADGDLTVIMTVNADAYYTVGVPGAATITLVDDDDAVTDGDSDGMDDGWEQSWWGDTTAAGTADADGDGLTNAAEYAELTDPTAADTDRDGSTDGDEVSGSADPLDPTSFTGGIIPPAPEVKEGWCSAGGRGENMSMIILAAVLTVCLWGRMRGER